MASRNTASGGGTGFTVCKPQCELSLCDSFQRGSPTAVAAADCLFGVPTFPWVLSGEAQIRSRGLRAGVRGAASGRARRPERRGGPCPPRSPFIHGRRLAAPGDRPGPSQSDASVPSRRRPIGGLRLLETRNP